MPRLFKSPYQYAQYHNQIKDHKAYRATEEFHVASSDAFAEEYAVVIVSVDANVTGAAVIHIFCHINIAFYAVQDLDFVAVAILSFFILRSIPQLLLRLLQSLFPVNLPPLNSIRACFGCNAGLFIHIFYFFL